MGAAGEKTISWKWLKATWSCRLDWWFSATLSHYRKRCGSVLERQMLLNLLKLQEAWLRVMFAPKSIHSKLAKHQIKWIMTSRQQDYGVWLKGKVGVCVHSDPRFSCSPCTAQILPSISLFLYTAAHLENLPEKHVALLWQPATVSRVAISLSRCVNCIFTRLSCWLKMSIAYF